MIPSELGLTADVADRWFDAVGAVWIRGLILICGTAVLASLFRHASAASRHFVWSCGLTASVALPFLFVGLPSWIAPISLPATGDAVHSGRQANTPPRAAAGGLSNRVAAVSPENVLVKGVRDAPPTPFRPPPVVAATPPSNTTAPAHSAGRSNVLPLKAALLLVYCLAAGAIALHFAVSFVRLRRLARSADGPVDRSMIEVVRDGCRLLGIEREIEIRVGHDRVAPATWGLRRPVVLLPTAACDWPPDRLRSVVLHELAHVKRLDWFVQLPALVACVVYWFIPLVWWAARQMRITREIACDDLVVASGRHAPDYAAHLLELARSLRPAKTGRGWSVVAARSSHLEQRMRAVLDTERKRVMCSRTTTSLVLVGVLAASAALASVRMQDDGRSTAANDQRPTAVSRRPSASNEKPATAARRAGFRQERDREQRRAAHVIRVRHARLEAAEARFEVARAGFTRAQKMLKAGTTSRHGFDEARLRFVEAQAVLDIARAELEAATGGDLRTIETRVRQSRLEIAEARYEAAANAYKRIERLAEKSFANDDDLQEARLRFAEAQAEIDIARAEFDAARSERRQDAARVRVAQARAELAEARLEAARHRFARIEVLRERQVASDIEVLEARAVLAEAEAGLVEARSKLEMAAEALDAASERGAKRRDHRR